MQRRCLGGGETESEQAHVPNSRASFSEAIDTVLGLGLGLGLGFGLGFGLGLGLGSGLGLGLGLRRGLGLGFGSPSTEVSSFALPSPPSLDLP